jgi:hypothetical protein
MNMARPGRKAGAPSNGDAAGNQSQGKPETLTGYFRRYFKQHRKLLNTRSNEEVLRHWQDEHPGDAVTESVKAALANAKSALRQKVRKKKGGRKAGQEGPAAGTEQALASAKTRGPAGKGMRGLERLEEEIDRCLDVAREIGREDFDDIIATLRRARREVVWKMGQ